MNRRKFLTALGAIPAGLGLAAACDLVSPAFAQDVHHELTQEQLDFIIEATDLVIELEPEQPESTWQVRFSEYERGVVVRVEDVNVRILS